MPFMTMWFVPAPGITEAYIMMAYSVEKLLGNRVRLLSSQFNRMVRVR